MEPTENIQCFCEKCSPKDAKAKELVHENPVAAIGKYAKVPFEVDDPNLSGREYMWVYVQTYADGFYSGSLRNHPMYVGDLSLGDTVSFALDDIAQLDG
jgi:uncharacterized protein YegJ (DUF2314 family)